MTRLEFGRPGEGAVVRVTATSSALVGYLDASGGDFDQKTQAKRPCPTIASGTIHERDLKATVTARDAPLGE
jgi:hypothetical protein